VDATPGPVSASASAAAAPVAPDAIVSLRRVDDRNLMARMNLQGILVVSLKSAA
jgi:hypothetical protein